MGAGAWTTKSFEDMEEMEAVEETVKATENATTTIKEEE